MKAHRLLRCADDAALAAAVAAAVERTLAAALAQRAEVSLSLPGGSTPRRYLPAVARLTLAWSRVWIVPGDERWVARDSADSNEHLLREMLLPGPAEAAHWLSLKTGDATPVLALTTLERRLAALPWPLDLAVLGVGDDGHIASLFPGDALDAPGRVVAGTAPVAPQARVSLGLATLRAARAVLLVASGAHKCALIEAAFAGAGSDLPLHRLVADARGEVQAIVGP